MEIKYIIIIAHTFEECNSVPRMILTTVLSFPYYK